MKYTPVGVDIAKHLIQVHFINEHTGEVVDKQLRSKDFLTFFSNREPCLIGMEACGGLMSEKRLAAGQRRSLSALKRKITGLAAEWGDTDYSVMAALSRICDSIDEADEQLRYVLEEKYLIRENDDI